jgi:hypothetical protein
MGESTLIEFLKDLSFSELCAVDETADRLHYLAQALLY